MRNIKLVVPSNSQREMNGLIDKICEAMGQDPKALKDKFKMIDIPSPKKIMDLCEHLKLNVEFRNEGKDKLIAVSIRGVSKNFNIEEPAKEERKEQVKDKEVVVTKSADSTGPTTADEIFKNLGSDSKQEMGRAIAEKVIPVQTTPKIGEVNDSDDGDDDIPF